MRRDRVAFKVTGSVYEWWNLTLSHHAIVTTLVCLALLPASAWLLYARRFRPHGHLESALALLAAMVLVLSGHALAFAVHHHLEFHSPHAHPAEVRVDVQPGADVHPSAIEPHHGAGAMDHVAATEPTKVADHAAKKATTGTFVTLFFALILFPTSLIVVHSLRGSVTGIRSLGMKAINPTPATPIAVPASKPKPPIEVFALADHPVRARHMIVPLSVPSHRPDFVDGLACYKGQDGETVCLEGSIGPDIEKLSKVRPNWQQLLRAIQPHVDHLESVWIFGSSAKGPTLHGPALDEAAPKGERIAFSKQEELGSSCFIHEAAKLLRPYLRERVKIHTAASRGLPLYFHDVRGLQDAIRAIAAEIDDDSHHILIDATGGMKTTSIVGALSTMNHEGMFQYVSTSEPYEVFVVDQRIELPPDLPG